MLGLNPWARQVELLSAVAKSPRVAVRSGHKVGKSNSAASLALWWVCTRERARVVMTSASARQVKSILWKELKHLYRTARVPVGGEMHDAPDTGLQFADGREVVGFSTNEPERMAGISGANVLFILDEASGIPEPIFEAIEGNRAGGAREVTFSNPTKTSGTFFDAFNSKRSFWRTVHVSSEESPNVTAGRVVVPGLATGEWVTEKRQEWGEGSSLYQVRVRGNFPAQGENTVIALALVEEATERWAETAADGPLEIGVDPAEFGDDDTVIQPRRGLKALRKKVLHSMDPVDVAGHALAVARELRQKDERPAVKVDVIGIGAGVAATLVRCNEVRVVRVNAAEKATDKTLHNMRAQLWVGMRDWLKEGGAFEPDSKLEAELVAPTYHFDNQGRMVIEKKEDIRKRLNRSTDRADSLALAVYSSPVAGGWI